MNARAEPPEREPPHSAEAEQSLLGALLLDPEAWARVADLVTAADFYDYQNRVIYEVIADLLGRGEPIDAIIIFERLQAREEAEACGGLQYLDALRDSVPSAANVRRYAEMVRERASHRRLIAAADEALALAWDAAAGSPLPGLLDRMLGAFDGIAVATGDGPRELGRLAQEALDTLTELHEADAPPGWPTGLPRLDSLLAGGLHPGRLYTLAARPAVGKSSLGAWLALKLAGDGLRVLVLSLEMSAREVAVRCLGALGRIPGRELATGRLSAEGWSGLSAAVEESRRLPLHIDDEAGLTLQAILAKAKRIRGLQVLIVDYLQLAQGDPATTRNDQIERITRGLKVYAKQAGVAVLVLSQLNRDVERRGDKRPMLADLRDSGGIEQDSDAVLLSWPLQPLATGHRLVGLEVAKHRQGETGVTVLDFEPATHRWAQSTARLNDPIKGPAFDEL